MPLSLPHISCISLLTNLNLCLVVVEKEGGRVREGVREGGMDREREVGRVGGRGRGRGREKKESESERWRARERETGRHTRERERERERENERVREWESEREREREREERETVARRRQHPACYLSGFHFCKSETSASPEVCVQNVSA